MLEGFCTQNNLSEYSISMLRHLQKAKPYTDEEIIEAIEKINQLKILSMDEIVSLLVTNETVGLS